MKVRFVQSYVIVSLDLWAQTYCSFCVGPARIADLSSSRQSIPWFRAYEQLLHMQGGL